MNKKITTSLIGALLGIISVNSFAIPVFPPQTTYSEGSRTDNRVYAALSWTLGKNQGLMPDYVVGFRSLHVESSDSVQGGDFNVRVKYNKGIVLDNVRLAYVDGKRDFVGNYGVGYSFLDKGIFGTVAGQGNYYRFGGDYSFKNHDIKPYVEINTLEKPDSEEPNTSTSCPVNYILDNGFCVPNYA